MNSIILSMTPKGITQIVDRSKIYDIRKSKPSFKPPFKVVIYCTKEPFDLYKENLNIGYFHALKKYFNKMTKLNQKVIAEFICDYVSDYIPIKDVSNKVIDYYTLIDTTKLGLTSQEILEYGKGKRLYAWHISNFKIYNKPKTLNEFNIKYIPQNWSYVKENKE